MHLPKGTSSEVLNQIYPAAQAALNDPELSGGIKSKNLI